MRRLLAAFGAGALICGPTVLAFFSGGISTALGSSRPSRPGPSSRSPPSSRHGRCRRRRAGRVALAGLALLCAWIAVSMSWAPIGERALDDLQRALLYLGFFVAALALLRADGVERVLEPAMVLGATVVVGYALSERLLPDLIELSRSRSSAGRLEQPISYWNALGAVAAIGFVLAVRVAGDLDRARWLRGSAAAAGVSLGPRCLSQLLAGRARRGGRGLADPARPGPQRPGAAAKRGHDHGGRGRMRRPGHRSRHHHRSRAG